MAIFLSRIKRALNVGSKSITNNGTYYASADGYDGYDEVTVNVSGGSATPITPSNANPVALSSGVAVEPTANGYAIQSYDSVTPSSTPASVASGDIVKIGGSGVIVDSVPSPTSVTPSDSTPPQLTQGNLYEPTANGYLYASSGLSKVKTGTFSTSTSTYATVDCGFQPKYIAIELDGMTSGAKHGMVIYNADTSTTYSYVANSNNYPYTVNTGNASSTNNSIDILSTGFRYRLTVSPVRTCRYFAIG